jgi:hypothetical protein
MHGLAWKPKGDHFEDLGIDGRIILIMTVRNRMGWRELDSCNFG